VWSYVGVRFRGSDCDQGTLKQVGDFPKAAAKLFPDGQVQGKAIALMSEDNTSARVSVADFAKIWQRDGAKVVLLDTSVPTPPAVVADYTPFAEKIMTSNNGGQPDYVQVLFATSDTVGLYKKLVQVGFTGIMQGFSNYDPRLLGGTKGLVTNIQMAPFEDAGTVPEVQQMVTDLKAYQPDVTLSQPAAAGYWTADFLINALEKAGPNLSREALYNAINSGFLYEAGGALAPVQWPAGHFGVTAAAAYVQDEGNHFAVPVHLTPLLPIDNPGYTGK
jgi:ABC-type branched-subunit amino acid transport system substrate-binding protein